jgi:RHS repeat-associated protein
MTVLYLDGKQDLGRCAMSCFAATLAQSTVPYFSLDAPRSVTLAYHGDRVAPKPFVAVDVFPDTTFGAWPSEYQLQVKVNGSFVTFLNNETLLRFQGTSGSTKYRLAGQFTPPALANGTVDSLEILVTAIINSSSYTNRWVTQYLHIDEANSPIARGWTLAGVQRAFIVSGTGVLVTEGDGSATYFKYNPVTHVYDAPAGDFSTLSFVSPNWVRAYPDSTKLTFTSAGLMVKLTDRWGVRRDSAVYDGSNRVTKLVDPLNNGITLAYGTNGLSTITDPMGRVTTVTVQANKTLTAIKDPDSDSTAFGYDGSLRLQTITDRKGKATALAYDAQSGKVSTVTAPQVPIYGLGNQSPVTTLASWQKKGVPYGSTTITPFATLKVDSIYAQITEPGGALSTFTVNRWGTPQRTTNALGEVTTVTFNSLGLPVKSVAPGYGSAFDSLAYNGSGLVTYQQSAGGPTTSIIYGGWAEPTTITATGQQTVTRSIGANGRLDSVRAGSQVVQRITAYDGYGRPVTVKDGKSVTMATYTYAGSGTNRNVQSVTAPGSRVTSFSYDTYGRRVQVVRPGNLIDSTFYSSINRVDSTRNALGGKTKFGYDKLYLISVTDSKNQTYQYTYNDIGWPVSAMDPVNRADSLFYSKDGDVMLRKTRRNLSITFSYDSLHRLKTQTGTNNLSWTYTNFGRQVTAQSPKSTETFYGNLLGVPDSVKTVFADIGGQNYMRRYRYTSGGLLDSVEVTGGGITSFQGRKYLYDTNRGLLTTIRLGGRETIFTVDENSLPTGIRLPGGDTLQNTFGNLHAPIKMTSTGPYASDFTERFVGTDSVGRVDQMLWLEGYQGRFYTYDKLGRLTAGRVQDATGSWPPGCPDADYGVKFCAMSLTWQQDGVTDSVTYDAVGNRTDKGGTYTTGNRIANFDGCTYTTNAEGADSTKTCGSVTTSFTWNAEGELTGVTKTGGPTVSFYYDALGRVIRKDSAGTANAYFLWDGDNLIAELGPTGTTKIAEYSYYPGMDHLHALVIGSTPYYGHSDPLGSVIALTDDSLAVKRSERYDDWGRADAFYSQDNLPFNGKDRPRWKGALWMGPEYDVYYMRNRWYDPATGRFLSEDPLGLDGGVNPLVFAGGDPVGGADPTGLRYDDCVWVAAVGGWYCVGHGDPGSLPPILVEGSAGGKGSPAGNWIDSLLASPNGGLPTFPSFPVFGGESGGGGDSRGPGSVKPSPPQESPQCFSRNLQTGLDFFGIPITVWRAGSGGVAATTVGGYAAQVVGKRVADRATVNAIISASNAGPGEGAALTRAARWRSISNWGGKVAKVGAGIAAFATGYLVGTAVGCATGILQ